MGTKPFFVALRKSKSERSCPIKQVALGHCQSTNESAKATQAELSAWTTSTSSSTHYIKN
jgi:hypothetical protein